MRKEKHNCLFLETQLCLPQNTVVFTLKHSCVYTETQLYF